jgi:hypothetical protein
MHQFIFLLFLNLPPISVWICLGHSVSLWARFSRSIHLFAIDSKMQFAIDPVAFDLNLELGVGHARDGGSE